MEGARRRNEEIGIRRARKARRTQQGQGYGIFSFIVAHLARVCFQISIPFSRTFHSRQPLLQLRGIHDDFQKREVVTHICMIIQFRDGTEHGATRGDVHFPSWSLKAALDLVLTFTSSLQIRSIHDDFQKHGVVTHICMIIQFRDGTEHGATTGDVGFPSWSLEG